MGFRIITSEHLVVQYRFPRTKKRRIRKKWRQDPRNWKPDPRAYIYKEPTLASVFGRPDSEGNRPKRLVCHPTLKKHIVSAALRVK